MAGPRAAGRKGHTARGVPAKWARLQEAVQPRLNGAAISTANT
jgi:hypothetical protein